MFLLLSISGAEARGQEPADTAFLLREKKGDYYHAVFIDTTRSSPAYDRVSDFSIEGYDQDSYDMTRAYLRDSGVALTTHPIAGLPRRWVTLYVHQGKYVAYYPSDFLANHRIEIRDSMVVDFNGEGPVVNKIARYRRLDERRFAFGLVNMYDGEYALTIHLVDTVKGIAVFEERPGGEALYYLMVDAAKIRMLPIVVNYCATSKTREFVFKEPDLKALLKSSRRQRR